MLDVTRRENVVTERQQAREAPVIHARAEVSTGSAIGPGSSVAADVFIDADVVISARVRVERGALLYRGSVVEDGVLIGPGAMLTNETYARAITTTGDLVDPEEREPEPVRLRRGCTIGAGTIVVAGREVGSFAMVGAGAVVTRDVPAHALVAGSPARRIGWVCACGERLLDSLGHPAPAVPERYATDPVLTCASCDRRYDYVPDEDSLDERRAPLPQGRPA